MGLFGKKKSAESVDAAIKEIEQSVRLVRARMSNAKMPLGDLFAMMSEDERPSMAAMPVGGGAEPKRILPDQIARPAAEKTPTRVDARGGQFKLGPP